MQISPDFVKWDVVTVKADNGALLDDLYEIEEDVDWTDNECNWQNDSYINYGQVAEALNLIAPQLSENNKAACQKSITLLINERMNMPRKLGDALDPEYFPISISPQTISSILQGFNQVDFEELKRVYLDEVSSNLKENIGAYEKGFEEYAIQWKCLLEQASDKGIGILVHVG